MRTIFATDRRLGRHVGALLCVAALALLTARALVWSALGLELLAAAFWWWARAASDADRQLARWGWLRRPAGALWLATAIVAAVPAGMHGAGLWRRLEGAAVLWAGLDLLGALPFARPFPDVAGPLVAGRPWLPVLLPAAGFLVLWRHPLTWQRDPLLATIAAVLLLVTAALATLRGFARPGWIACLRWLVVADSAMAGLLVAVDALSAQAMLGLWACGVGGHATMLAGELRGASPRRGRWRALSWRIATWVALAALSAPLLARIGWFGESLRPLAFATAALPVVLVGWVTVARIAEAPERRTLPRNALIPALLRLVPLVLVLGAPLSLALGWAYAAPPAAAIATALLPALLGGAIALAGTRAMARAREAAVQRVEWLGLGARHVAGGTFRIVVLLEQRLIALVRGIVLGLTAPVRDLHTGDAQEYLLLLASLAVLALVLPLLRG